MLDVRSLWIAYFSIDDLINSDATQCHGKFTSKIICIFQYRGSEYHPQNSC